MKQASIFIFIMCILLCVCGCVSKPAENEIVEWPTEEEIRSTIAAEQAEVYWMADVMPIPDQVICYSAAALDIDAFWNKLNENMQNTRGQVENDVLYIFDGADQIQTILEALSDATGATFTEVSVMEDDTTIQHCYAQTIDGINLDTEGYMPGGGVEVIPGTRVNVYEDGRVSVQNPLILSQQTQTLQKEELMAPEDAPTLCSTYYQTYGLPCVTVVTGMDLVYYAIDGELHPAWQFDETWYPSEKGHITSQMVDGQTGEFLRK